MYMYIHVHCILSDKCIYMHMYMYMCMQVVYKPCLVAACIHVLYTVR